ncbi:hypothetical protein [Methylovulum psychrotolerans]|jgi:hypothetical protein|uniref:Uncharacterized protein n=1 Tax=Methylovulum psychrotolerans TaxID=1704499 RepID=A0A1Z4C4U8_9GAMM|nr:hypothetical protein [Methylovulum psychrotolerans]ASF48504.1 hypothetical protein CEK71_21940 [Methylovulum psychrotolerans]MBT9099991.1 hypothetical protein [Methylovulum psychrotolerans]
MRDSLLRPQGRFVLEVFRDGQLCERVDEPNLIVVGYQAMLAQLLGSGLAGQWAVSQIGFGTSGVTPTFQQTVLANGFVKAVDGVAYPAANKVEFAFSLDAGEANGKAIFEFGLLAGNGTLFARKVRTQALAKTGDISLSGRWSIEFL